MKIHKISKSTRTANSLKLDHDAFTSELRSLSEHYGVKLLSIGAFSSVDATGPAYIAIWTAEPTDK